MVSHGLVAFLAFSEHALKHWQTSIQVVKDSDFLLALGIPVDSTCIL